MALNIRNPEAEKLASELAALTGESKTEAVTRALRERLEHIKRLRRKRRIASYLSRADTPWSPRQRKLGVPGHERLPDSQTEAGCNNIRVLATCFLTPYAV